MRLYLKLLAAIALFAIGAQVPARDIVAEAALTARVAMVSRFGSADDFERLVDDTQRRLAAARGELPVYELGKRFDALFAERLAVATCTNGPLSEADVARVRDACAAEVFTPMAVAAMRAPPAVSYLPPSRCTP
jgi:hypothetical protein